MVIFTPGPIQKVKTCEQKVVWGIEMGSKTGKITFRNGRCLGIAIDLFQMHPGIISSLFYLIGLSRQRPAYISQDSPLPIP